jgi:hypothetical protein
MTRGRAVRRAGAVLMVLAASSSLGCVTVTRETWVKPAAAPAARLAVVPFDNQTPALRAGLLVSDVVVAELFARGVLPVMDPSEVQDLLRRENLDPTDTTRLPSAQRLGRILRASHVLQGAVTEYRYKPGLSEVPVVGVTARVVEVASGDVVWTASQARTGSVWFREDGLAHVTQAIAQEFAEHLADALRPRAR